MKAAAINVLSRLVLTLLVLVFSVVIEATTVGCGIRRAPEPETEQQIEAKVVTLMQQGVAEMRQGDLNRSEANFALARELRPNDPRVLDGYGCIALRRANYERAKSFFKQAILADPKYSRPYAHLAMIARLNGDLQAANELLVAALTLNPLNSLARVEYSKLLKLIDSPRASQELLKAHALEPIQY